MGLAYSLPWAETVKSKVFFEPSGRQCLQKRQSTGLLTAFLAHLKTSIWARTKGFLKLQVALAAMADVELLGRSRGMGCRETPLAGGVSLHPMSHQSIYCYRRVSSLFWLNRSLETAADSSCSVA